MALLSFFRRRTDDAPEPPSSDSFDIFHRKTVAAIIDSRGLPLSQWSGADAENRATAARFVLGLLRERPRIRRRFPRALSPDGGYREYLRSAGAKEFRLSASAVGNVDGLFESSPGAAVREYYMHTAWLQSRYPLALLPIGQKRFAKWLFGKGRSQHGFSDEQILWFLHETADDVALGSRRHIS